MIEFDELNPFKTFKKTYFDTLNQRTALLSILFLMFTIENQNALTFCKTFKLTFMFKLFSDINRETREEWTSVAIPDLPHTSI